MLRLYRFSTVITNKFL